MSSQTYMAYVQVLEKELSMESGSVDMLSDEIEVDADRRRVRRHSRALALATHRSPDEDGARLRAVAAVV